VCADVRVRSFIAPTLSDPPTHRACAWRAASLILAQRGAAACPEARTCATAVLIAGMPWPRADARPGSDDLWTGSSSVDDVG
jgi:hypothetical protein